MTAPGGDSLYDRAMALFDELCELDPDAQRAALLERCVGDDALRQRVEKMLAQDAAPEGPLVGAGGDGVSILAASLAEDDRPPERIGRYRVLGEIGRGGMGVVYEAEQDQPRRRVALKVIRHGFLTSELRRRFERETQVLGRLDHPGIAQIYEADSARIGASVLPFFAMELIEGRPLDAYARDRALGPRETLELVARVCDAVQHAHQRGIIHRDLKPSNILVKGGEPAGSGPGTTTVLDAVGRPKILDFGIARVTDTDAHAITAQTDAGKLVGTLAFMSPEQVVGRSADLDTRCDVYAIGVILYTLLAGRPLFDLSGRPITDAVRIVTEEEPTPLGAAAPAMRGDVETIVAKAIEKDRDRRYGSAADLAEDIRRYLRDEPVLAHPPSTLYQATKFARRNKALVGGAGATLVALVAGLIASGVLLARVAEQRDAARLATARSERVSQFQTSLLQRMDVDDMGRDIERLVDEEFARVRRASPGVVWDPADPGPDGVLGPINPTNLARVILADSIIDRAIELADSDYSDDPAVEADIRLGLADILRELGRYGEAADQFRIAVDRLLEVRGPDDWRTISAQLRLAMCLNRDGQFEAVVRLIEGGLLERCERLRGTSHRYTIRAAFRLARAYRGLGRADDARRFASRALDWARALGDTELIRNCLNDLGAIAIDAGEPDLAIRYFDEFFEIAAAQEIDESNSEFVITINNLMAALYTAGRLDEAERYARRAVPLFDEEFGDRHPRAIMSRNNHARVLLELGRADEALSLLAPAHDLALETLSPRNEVRQALGTNLTDALLAVGRPADAEPVARALLADRRAAERPRPSAVAQTLEQLGICLLDQGELAGAEASFAECVELRESIDPDAWTTHRTRSLLGVAIAGQGRVQEAGPLVIGGSEGVLRLRDAIPRSKRDREIDDARERIDAFRAPRAGEGVR